MLCNGHHAVLRNFVQMRACHEWSCDHSDLLLGLVCLPKFVCAERLAVTVVAVECLIAGLFEWELLYACSLTCSVLVPCQRIRDFHRLLCTSLSQWTAHVSSILAVVVTCLELLLMVRCAEWTTRLLARQISTVAKTIYSRELEPSGSIMRLKAPVDQKKEKTSRGFRNISHPNICFSSSFTFTMCYVQDVGMQIVCQLIDPTDQ